MWSLLISSCTGRFLRCFNCSGLWLPLRPSSPRKEVVPIIAAPYLTVLFLLVSFLLLVVLFVGTAFRFFLIIISKLIHLLAIISLIIGYHSKVRNFSNLFIKEILNFHFLCYNVEILQHAEFASDWSECWLRSKICFWELLRRWICSTSPSLSLTHL
jgi:hypothetical protein